MFLITFIILSIRSENVRKCLLDNLFTNTDIEQNTINNISIAIGEIDFSKKIEIDRNNVMEYIV